MEKLDNQQENGVLIEVSEQDLEGIAGGRSATIAYGMLSGVKGMYRAGKDLGIPKSLNAPTSLILGPLAGAGRVVAGRFPGSEAIRQQIVQRVQKRLAKH